MLKLYLQEYEEKDCAHQVKILYDNPVFTNVILTNINIIKLLDMQGLLGQTVALWEDATYNFVKVYQSLMGYDFLLNDLEMT